jgi:hypothetical protein
LAIHYNSNIDDIAASLNLPISPTPQSLTPYEARVWYSWRKTKIGVTIDYAPGLEAAARQAVDLRNTIRSGTRDCMLDADIAQFLNSKEVNKTFQELYVEKAISLSPTTPDKIYEAIIESSMKGRGLVDILYKIPK